MFKWGRKSKLEISKDLIEKGLGISIYDDSVLDVINSIKKSAEGDTESKCNLLKELKLNPSAENLLKLQQTNRQLIDIDDNK